MEKTKLLNFCKGGLDHWDHSGTPVPFLRIYKNRWCQSKFLNTIFSAGNLEPTARVTWVTSEFHLVTLKKNFYITPFWSIPYVFNVRPKKVPPTYLFNGSPGAGHALVMWLGVPYMGADDISSHIHSVCQSQGTIKLALEIRLLPVFSSIRGICFVICSSFWLNQSLFILILSLNVINWL